MIGLHNIGPRRNVSIVIGLIQIQKSTKLVDVCFCWNSSSAKRFCRCLYSILVSFVVNIYQVSYFTGYVGISLGIPDLALFKISLI